MDLATKARGMVSPLLDGYLKVAMPKVYLTITIQQTDGLPIHTKQALTRWLISGQWQLKTKSGSTVGIINGTGAQSLFHDNTLVPGGV